MTGSSALPLQSAPTSAALQSTATTESPSALLVALAADRRLCCDTNDDLSLNKTMTILSFLFNVCRARIIVCSILFLY